MQQVNRPNVMDYMSPGLLMALTPQARVTLSRTPTTIVPTPEYRGWGQANPDEIFISPNNPDMANHEALHVLSGHTPSMDNGGFPPGSVPTHLAKQMASAYGDPTSFATGFEDYPMALSVNNWQPWNLPQNMQHYYEPWMSLVPQNMRWH